MENRIKAEDVLSIVRTTPPVTSNGRLWYSEQPVIPDKPIAMETVKRLRISGGPIHDSMRGYVVMPWKLFIQEENRPVTTPTSFHFVYVKQLEVWDTHEAAVKLPLWKSMVWEFRCWLYNGDKT